MTTTPNAGSATGIDLAALEQLAQRAYMANEVVAMIQPAKILDLIALARATPQHPEAETSEIAKFRNFAGNAATPQHSVTEQASEREKFEAVYLDQYGPEHADSVEWAWNTGAGKMWRAARAQPLASTAATQPEQASDFAVRFIEQRAQKYLDENAHSDWDTGSVIFNCGEAGQDYYNSLVELADDIRAALAIPASTAASEQQAGADELPDASRFTGEIMAKLDEYGMAVRDDNADWRSRVRGEMFDAVYDRAALSGRATIPSEADERALFDAYMKTPAPDDYDASVKDAWLIWQEAWRAALTHRATTAIAVSQHEAIVSAIARGWWSVTPGKAPMDDALIHAIAGEVGPALAAAPDIATTAADQQGVAQLPQSDPRSDPKSPQSEGAAQAGDGERLKAAIVASLNSHEREMEGYSYFGSNPGVAHEDYDEVAAEVVAAMAAPATSGGGNG